MTLIDKNIRIFGCSSTDISENIIRETMPSILNILLIDRTMSNRKKKNNIIWANNNYIQYGYTAYAAKKQIISELVTGQMGNIIKPRALKTIEEKKDRTRSKGEVFTPTWIVKQQNDEIDRNYKNDTLEEYIKRKWLEVACGEAPYMATRYDMETGDIVSLKERTGFVDRKLKRINLEIEDKEEWQKLVEEAYKSSYGFEWNGDSLLIARENLLYTYRDYYFEKWAEEPLYGLFENIAEIISYNIFQMDGIKNIIPLSETKKKMDKIQLSLFDDLLSEEEWEIKSGELVKIMNWETKKMEFFDEGAK